MFRKAVLIALLAASSATAATYELPFRANDLAQNERWEADNHGGGIQDQAKDVVLWRHVSGTQWSELKTNGADAKIVDNWLSYGRPVYALAAGTVIACWRNAPDNIPGSYHADFLAKKYAGGGNHIWIRYDDGSVGLHAHMKPGSVPSAICPHNAKLFKGTSGKGGSPDIEPEAKVENGARISVGQKLGEVGNSGASGDKPHHHFHVEAANKPVVMRFARGMWADFAGKKSSLTGPWSGFDNQAMPDKKILVWPPHRVGDYTWNGTPDEDYQRLFDHMVDSRIMPTVVSCANNGQSYNSQWAVATGQWRSHHGMTAAVAAAKHALYTSQGFKRTSSSTCGSRQVAVWRK